MAHGSKNIDILAPRSSFHQGPYGRIFGDLAPWIPELSTDSEIDAFLIDVANNQMVEMPGKKPSEMAGDDQLRDQLEEKFSSNIPAGYTYFGQFIDHDITFDPTSSLVRKNDPNALRNFRTPRMDLDCVYGAGPDDQPYLYDAGDKAKLAIGEIEGHSELPDLPRFRGRALIGDSRNDENSIVSQLHLAFLLAHNTLVERARKRHPAAPTSEVFEMARKSLRWLYQFIVWHDFVRRITIDDVQKCALQLTELCGGRKQWTCGLNDVYSWKNQPFMPVEFSVAAYRFGHSLVRNEYQTNNPFRGFGQFAPIFDNSGATEPDDLRGFRPIRPENFIQWDWFLPMVSSRGPFPQMAHKIDTKLANALAFLHEGPTADPLNILAFRNLKRGLAFDLPSGTAVAKKFCFKPVKLKRGEPDALWYYVLKEAQANGGNALGRVGSTIVCAVFAGLLKGDPNSWINIEPCWTPDDDPLLNSGTLADNRDDNVWTLASIIRLANLKADGVGIDISNL